jgi:hypothetical protein
MINCLIFITAASKTTRTWHICAILRASARCATRTFDTGLSTAAVALIRGSFVVFASCIGKRLVSNTEIIAGQIITGICIMYSCMITINSLASARCVRICHMNTFQAFVNGAILTKTNIT